MVCICTYFISAIIELWTSSMLARPILVMVMGTWNQLLVLIG